MRSLDTESTPQRLPQSVQSPQAEQLRQLRRRCWRVALLLAPVCVPLCGLASRTLPAPGRALAALRALQQAADGLRAVPHPSRIRAHAVARESASAALADVDTDDRMLDRLIADLTSYQAGDARSLLEWMDPAVVAPSLWTTWASAVLATHRALWIARHGEHTAT